ncbi:uncharacterized protein LOC120683509 [Panicum virgatum]|uniref:DUF7138 domain-containing protein n=1 Tax=Panicum virgatum TaxID=38727 RepID=A0A8T0Q9M8_PANVG|nr:uncharacterized protein LOC120683509 [Panicum virgatum]KAG2569918.1 hypothetical protein PVAP13_7NG420600 [Panicum virgatum]
MADLAAAPSPPPPAVLSVLFVDGDRTVDLGTVTVHPSLAVKKLQAVVADRVGVAPHQISAALARPRRARRVPLDEGADLAAAAAAREGAGCYVLASLRRARRGGRARRDKHKASAADAAPPPEKAILKRLPPTDLASMVAPAAMLGGWDYEAQLREQRDWYLMSTAAAADPYLLPLVPELEDPPMWSPRPACPECEAAAAAMRQPPFHWCVRDAVVTAGFRSHVGPIERPAKKSPSPPPSPGRLPGLLGMPVY